MNAVIMLLLTEGKADPLSIRQILWNVTEDLGHGCFLIP
jgi:hypothetical protein